MASQPGRNAGATKLEKFGGKASHRVSPMRDLPVDYVGAILSRRLGHAAREFRGRRRCRLL